MDCSIWIYKRKDGLNERQARNNLEEKHLFWDLWGENHNN